MLLTVLLPAHGRSDAADERREDWPGRTGQRRYTVRQRDGHLIVAGGAATGVEEDLYHRYREDERHRRGHRDTQGGRPRLLVGRCGNLVHRPGRERRHDEDRARQEERLDSRRDGRAKDVGPADRPGLQPRAERQEAEPRDEQEPRDQCIGRPRRDHSHAAAVVRHVFGLHAAGPVARPVLLRVKIPGLVWRGHQKAAPCRHHDDGETGQAAEEGRKLRSEEAARRGNTARS